MHIGNLESLMSLQICTSKKFPKWEWENFRDWIQMLKNFKQVSVKVGQSGFSS